MAKSPTLRALPRREHSARTPRTGSATEPERNFTLAASPVASEASATGHEGTGLITGADGRTRCWWSGQDPLYVRYHDEEWGRPVRDDHRLFEKICLEGFQSGLSWLTILRKREHFREAFEGFDPEARRPPPARDVTRLMKNTGIVRHRGKIESTINNAKRALELIEEMRFAGQVFLGLGTIAEGTARGVRTTCCGPSTPRPRRSACPRN